MRGSVIWERVVSMGTIQERRLGARKNSHLSPLELRFPLSRVFTCDSSSPHRVTNGGGSKLRNERG